MKSVFGLICRKLVRACRCAGSVSAISENQAFFRRVWTIVKSLAEVQPATVWAIRLRVVSCFLHRSRLSRQTAGHQGIIAQFRNSKWKSLFIPFNKMLLKVAHVISIRNSAKSIFSPVADHGRKLRVHISSARSQFIIARLYDGGFPQRIYA